MEKRTRKRRGIQGHGPDMTPSRRFEAPDGLEEELKSPPEHLGGAPEEVPTKGDHKGPPEDCGEVYDGIKTPATTGQGTGRGIPSPSDLYRNPRRMKQEDVVLSRAIHNRTHAVPGEHGIKLDQEVVRRKEQEQEEKKYMD